MYVNNEIMKSFYAMQFISAHRNFHLCVEALMQTDSPVIIMRTTFRANELKTMNSCCHIVWISCFCWLLGSDSLVDRLMGTSGKRNVLRQYLSTNI